MEPVAGERIILKLQKQIYWFSAPLQKLIHPTMSKISLKHGKNFLTAKIKEKTFESRPYVRQADALVTELNNFFKNVL